MKSLFELYKIHTGKVSDKWELYLIEYDRLFAPFRDQKISLLEIGIQNGGSLEIWGQYFPNAHKLVGCDINQNCANLIFNDPRIAIVVGDATLKKVQTTVLAHCNSFDLIIEDGSHTSGDIVKAFARYFPSLNSGGLFVAEDLQCSYWQEYDGGIYHPFSSITFFKYLADVINHEHWGVAKSRSELISGFKELLNVDFEDDLLAEISSIEFINSICIVRKKTKDKNHLGARIISGRTELVAEGLQSLSGNQSNAPDQNKNGWTILSKSPAEQFEKLQLDVQAKQAESYQLQSDVKAKQAESYQLQSDVKAKQALVNQLNQDLDSIKKSRSWRYTSAIRTLFSLMLLPLHFSRKIKASAKHNHGYKNLIVKVLQIRRKEGWKGISARWTANNSSALVLTTEGQAVDRNDYQVWIKLYDTLDAQDIEQIKTDIKGFKTLPKISVVMPVYNAPLNFLKEAIESVQNQIYQNWELCIADDASTDQNIRLMLDSFSESDKRIKVIYRVSNGHISAASNSALEVATGEYVALLDNDDLLPIHALYRVAKVIIDNPNVVLIYSDEDKINCDGFRHGPYFKTGWNIDLFYSHNMFSHLGVYKRSLIKKLGGFKLGLEGSQDYDLALRCIEQIDKKQIFHLPYILYHWRVHPGSTSMSHEAKPYAIVAGERAINDHFIRTKVNGFVKLTQSGYHPHYLIPEPPPLVSIIIPTRNNHELVMQCIESIWKLSTYPSYEILLIDNGSDDIESLKAWELLKSDGVNLIRENSDFNFSLLVNKGAFYAKGEILILLNNDTKVLTPNWIETMVSHAIRPGVGPVGVKLLHENNTIQHSGIILGLGGVAGHSHNTFPETSHGYFGRISLVSNFSAVTAACLAVRRDLFLQVNGFDELNLAIAFNDVDFCLRLGELGYRCVYAPDVVLYHFESSSRGADVNSEKLARFKKEEDFMRSRWSNLIDNDPFYSPNLTLHISDFSLAWPPRTK